MPLARAHCGRALVRVPADLLVRVGPAAFLAELLRLGRAALQQPDREQDEERELEVLGLPVLEHRRGELGGHHVAAERHVRIPVPGLVLVEVRVAGHRLQHDREQEQDQERE